MQTLFNGRYRIIKTIGSGGMGTVYLAESISLGTKWAIKAIPKKNGGNYDLLAEPNILKKINHPALPRIIDIEEDSENLYIIEDYIEGEPLDKQLHYRKKFDEATVIEWAKQLCRILNYLHSQKPNPIIYRDMKPSNIIVSADNVVKVIDFGIAREFKKDSGSDTSYMGTRGYAAPEQYGTGQTDARTDIYSLGATMYHLLTGKSPNEPPYEFKPLRLTDSSLSEGIEHIVWKCVRNNPADRYQNTEELLRDLDNIYTFNSFYKKQKRARKIRIAAEVAAFVCLAALSVFLGSRMIENRNEEYKNAVDNGYKYLQSYELEESKSCFEYAIERKKNDPAPYLGIAQILLRQGKYEECVSYLDNVAEQMPECEEDARYNYLRGSVIYEDENYELAKSYLKKACELDSSDNTYRRDLAVCYAKLGDLEKAKNILDKIQANGVDEDILNYVRGQVALAEGSTDEAIADFEKTISLTESEDMKTRSYLELSDIYKSMRHTDYENWTAINKQIEVLERAVKDLKDEDNLLITEAMAEAYFTAKKYDLSVQKFNRLIELGYERAYIYRNIAIIYQQTGKYSEAEQVLETMKEKYPDNYQCYLQLSYLYMDIEGEKSEDSRDYSEAYKNYKLAVKFAPNGKQTSDVMQLAAKINELKEKGWL